MNTRFRRSACYAGSALALMAFWASPSLESHQAMAQVYGANCEGTDIWLPAKDREGNTILVRLPGSFVGTCFGGGGANGPGGTGPLNPIGDFCGGGDCPTGPTEIDFPDLGSCEIEQEIEKEQDALASQAMTNIISQRNSERIEYGYAIYADALDNLRLSQISVGTRDGVDVNISDRRDGERVVAIIHNHPFDDIAAPSDDDRTGWGQLVFGYKKGGVSVPPRASASELSYYIFNMEDKELNEYDSQDMRQGRPNRDSAKDAEGECDD